MGSIEAALEDLESLKPGEKINITAMAKKHGVNWTTLSKRSRGVQGTKESQYENQQILNQQQKKTLIKWINDLTTWGLPPSHQMLCNFAKEINKKKPGKIWPYRFLKKYNKIVCKYITGIDKEQKRADSAFKYALYFKMLSKKI